MALTGPLDQRPSTRSTHETLSALTIDVLVGFDQLHDAQRDGDDSRVRAARTAIAHTETLRSIVMINEIERRVLKALEAAVEGIALGLAATSSPEDRKTRSRHTRD